MINKPPRALNKQQVKRDVAEYENRILKDPHLTLSQSFDRSVADVWDLAKMSAAELLALHENIHKKPMSSMLVVHLKRR
jgi:hypothetical protein